MDRAKILFLSTPSVFDFAIRKFTWSDFSHVEIVIDESLTIGANASSGVKVSNYNEKIAHAKRVVLIEFPCDKELGMRWALSQVDKKYDWGAIIGQPFRRDKWQVSDKWFCSEFAYMYLKKCGYEPYRSELQNRITPQDLYRLNLEFKVLK